MRRVQNTTGSIKTAVRIYNIMCAERGGKKKNRNFGFRAERETYICVFSYVRILRKFYSERVLRIVFSDGKSRI